MNNIHEYSEIKKEFRDSIYNSLVNGYTEAAKNAAFDISKKKLEIEFKERNLDTSSLDKILNKRINDAFNNVKFNFKIDNIDIGDLIGIDDSALQSKIQKIYSESENLTAKGAKKLLAAIEVGKGKNINLYDALGVANNDSSALKKRMKEIRSITRMSADAVDEFLAFVSSASSDVDINIQSIVNKLTDNVKNSSKIIDTIIKNEVDTWSNTVNNSLRGMSLDDKQIAIFAELEDKVSSGVISAENALRALNAAIGKGIDSGNFKSLNDAMNYLLTGISNFYKQTNGKQISGFWDNFKRSLDASDPSIKEELKSLGLIKEELNDIKLVNDGMVKSGGIIGDNITLLATKPQNGNITKRYEDTIKLKEKLDEAAKAGINVSRILDVVYDKETGMMLEAQKTAKGGILGSIYGQNDNDFVNTDFLNATDEQIQKLISDLITLNKLGLGVDVNTSNIFYDKESGFSFIDLDLNPTKYENEKELLSEFTNGVVDEIKIFYETIGDLSNNDVLDKFSERFSQLSESMISGYAKGQHSHSTSVDAENLEHDFTDGVEIGVNKDLKKLEASGEKAANAFKTGYENELSSLESENKNGLLSGKESLEELLKIYQKLGTTNGFQDNLNQISEAILNIVQSEKKLDASEMQKFATILKGLTFVEGDSPITKTPYNIDEAISTLNKLKALSNKSDISSSSTTDVVKENIDAIERQTEAQEHLNDAKREEPKITETFTQDSGQLSFFDSQAEKINGVSEYIVEEKEAFDKLEPSIQNAISLLDEYANKDLSHANEKGLWSVGEKIEYAIKNIRSDVTVQDSILQSAESNYLKIKDVIQKRKDTIEEYKKQERDFWNNYASQTGSRSVEIDSKNSNKEILSKAKYKTINPKDALYVANEIARDLNIDKKKFDVNSVSKMIRTYVTKNTGYNDILESIAIALKDNNDGMYDKVRKYISSSKIRVSDGVRSEFGDDYNKIAGTIGLKNLSSNSGTEITHVLSAMNEDLGTTFKSLDNVQDAFRELYKYLSNPPSSIDEKLKDISSDVDKHIREIIDNLISLNAIPAHENGVGFSPDEIDSLKNGTYAGKDVIDTEKKISEQNDIVAESEKNASSAIEESTDDIKQQTTAIEENSSSKKEQISENENLKKSIEDISKTTDSSIESDKKEISAIQEKKNNLKQLNDTIDLMISKREEMESDQAKYTMMSNYMSAYNKATNISNKNMQSDGTDGFVKFDFLDMAKKKMHETGNEQEKLIKAAVYYGNYLKTLGKGVAAESIIIGEKDITDTLIDYYNKMSELSKNENGLINESDLIDKVKSLIPALTRINSQINELSEQSKALSSEIKELEKEESYLSGKGKKSKRKKTDNQMSIDFNNTDGKNNNNLLSNLREVGKNQKNYHEVSKAKISSENILGEVSDMQSLGAKITEINSLIERKNQLFKIEELVVQEAVSSERNYLQLLIVKLEGIIDLLNKISEYDIKFNIDFKGLNKIISDDNNKDKFKDIAKNITEFVDTLNTLKLNDNNVLNVISEVLSKGDELSNLAKIINSSKKDIKKSVKTKEQKDNADNTTEGNKNAADDANKLKSEIDGLNSKLQSLSKRASEMSKLGRYTSEFQNRLSALARSADDFRINGIDENNISRANQYIDELDTIIKVTSKLKENNVASYNTLEKYQLKITQTLAKNTNAREEFKAGFRDLYDKISEMIKAGNFADEQVNEVIHSYNRLNTAMIQSGKTGDSMWKRLGQRLQDANARLFATYFSWQDLIRYARTAATTVIQLDTALVDLRKTTTMSTKELNEFYYSSNDIAQRMGVTTEEIINQAAAFSRLGYSSKEAAIQMSELSSQFASISPDMDVSTATDGLVSIMKAFNVEVGDVERQILDNINIIGNTAATSNGEIVDMLTRSSAAMKEANNSLEETIALETAAVEVTRNAETTGTAFKTLSMRIRGYDEETEELSEDLQNISGDIADLTKTASSPYGISLFEKDDPNTYKSTYQLLKDISEIWDELTDKQQAGLLEKIAGKRGGQVVASVLNNFDAVDKALNNMENASGSADREMEVIQDSITFKINELKQVWVGVLQDMIKRDDIGELISSISNLSKGLGNAISGVAPILKLFIDLLGDISNILSAVIDIFGKSTPYIAGFSTIIIKSLPSLKSFYKRLIYVQDAINGISDLEISIDESTGLLDKTSLASYTDAIKGLNAEQAKLVLSTTELDVAQKKQVLTKAGLIASSEAIRGDLAQEAILTSALSEAEKERILTSLGITTSMTGQEVATVMLTEAELEEALAAEGVVGENAKIIVSNTGVIASNTATSVSFGTLAKSIGSAALSMAKWLVTTPAGWATTIIGGIVGITHAISSHNKKAEEAKKEAREAAEDAKELLSTVQSNISDTESKIQSLNNELSSIDKKLKEIRSSGKLDLTSKEQLQNLNTQKNLLLQQQKILERNLELQIKSEAKSAKELLKTQYEYKSYNISTHGDIDSNDVVANDYNTAATNLSYDIRNLYANYLRQLQGGMSTGNVSDAIDSQKVEISNYLSYLMDIMNSFVDVDGNVISGYEAEYERIKNTINNLQVLSDPSSIVDIINDIKSNDFNVAEEYEKILNDVYAEGDYDFSNLNEDFVKIMAENGIDKDTLESIFRLKEAEYDAMISKIDSKYNYENMPTHKVGDIKPRLTSSDPIVQYTQEEVEAEQDASDRIKKINEELKDYAYNNPVEFGMISSYDDDFINLGKAIDKYIADGLLIDDAIEEAIKDILREAKEYAKNNPIEVEINPTKSLSQLKSDWGSFNDIYNEIVGGKTVSADSIAGLEEAFGNLDSYDDFIKVMTEEPYDTDKKHKALNELATDYANNSELIQNLTKANLEYAKSELIKNGATAESADLYLKSKLGTEYNANLEIQDLDIRSEESVKAIQQEYDEIENEIKARQIDLNKTVYGNIDTNNRQVINWTKDTLEQYKDVLQEWDEDAANDWDSYVENMQGSYSTVMGGSQEIQGVEIAFSPILQTENGAELLSSDTVTNYLNQIVDAAKDDTGKIDFNKVLQLDAEGIEVDGKKINGLIADIGDTAYKTGEAMHFTGALGAMNDAIIKLGASTKNLSEMTAEEIAYLISEGMAAGQDTTALRLYLAEKIRANQITLSTSGDMSNLLMLVKALGGASDALAKYSEIKAALDSGKSWSGNTTADLNTLAGLAKHAQDEIAAALGGGQKVNLDFGGVPPTDGGGAGSSSDDSADDFEETIDWVEVKIQRLEEEISRLDKTVGNTYTNWINRNTALAQQIADTTEEIGLQQLSYERYMKEANSIDLSEEYKSKVRSGALDIETITDENTKQKIDEYTEWYNKAVACSDAIQDLTINLGDLAKLKFDNVKKEYDDFMDTVSAYADIVDARISNVEERGYFVDKSYYEKLQQYEQKNNQELNKEYAALQKKLEEAISSGAIEEGSEAWREMHNEILGVEKAIVDSDTELVKLSNTIRQLEWDYFDYGLDRMKRIADEAEFINGLFKENNKYTDNGYLTEQGWGSAGMIGIRYDTYMKAAVEYAKEREKIETELANDKNNKDLIARYEELVDAQQDAIKSAEQEKEAMKSLVQEGINRHLESLSELIDKYKEAQQSAKELYEYQKDIAKKTDNITRLEKILSAYSGDTSEETRKIVQQTQVELDDAREELSETEWDHYISETEKILDNMYTEYEEVLNARLDDIDALMNYMVDESNIHADQIKESVDKVAEDVGYQLTSQFGSILDSDNADILTTFSGDFKNYSANVLQILEAIRKEVAPESIIPVLDENYGKEPTDGATGKGSGNGSNGNGYGNGSGGSSSGSGSGDSGSSSGGGDGNPEVGDAVTFVSGKYTADSYGGGASGSKRLGEQVYITLTNPGAKRPYHIGVEPQFSRNSSLGWVSLDQLSGYYTGSKNISEDQLAWTQEKGRELIYRASDGAMLTPLGEGDKVFTKQMSDNLWNVANGMMPNLKSTTAIPNISGAIGNTINNSNSITVSLPNVQNYDEFKSALQKDTKFEKFVQQVTLGEVLGKNSLKKNKY